MIRFTDLFFSQIFAKELGKSNVLPRALNDGNFIGSLRRHKSRGKAECYKVGWCMNYDPSCLPEIFIAGF